MNFYESVGFAFCILCGILGFLILVWLLFLGLTKIKEVNEDEELNPNETIEDYRKRFIRKWKYQSKVDNEIKEI